MAIIELGFDEEPVHKGCSRQPALHGGKEPIERIKVREESLANGGDGHTAGGRDRSTHYKALQEGLAWLQDYQPGEKPLLFMFDTNLPHPPFYWETEWKDRFEPEQMVLPGSYYEETFEGKPAFLKQHAEGAHAGGTVRPSVPGQRGSAAEDPVAGLGGILARGRGDRSLRHADEDDGCRRGRCVAGCSRPDERRQADVGQRLPTRQDDPWLVCTPETAVWFKKVCFFFARRLQRDILVPLGVINAAVGGSKIEPWIGGEPYGPGKHYQERIAPLVGYGLRGVLWYQGESNAGDGLPASAFSTNGYGDERVTGDD